MGWVLERMMQGRGGFPDQYGQRLFEQGLPCLKSGWAEGRGELLPVSPSSISHIYLFSLEVLGCLSESLTL